MLCRLALKVAVTAAVAATEHVVAVPVHAPLQPTNPNPVAGAAVRVTCETFVNVPEHVPGQLIPVGLLVTVPVPAPARVTVNPDTPFTSPWQPVRAITKRAAAASANSLNNLDMERSFVSGSYDEERAELVGLWRSASGSCATKAAEFHCLAHLC